MTDTTMTIVPDGVLSLSDASHGVGERVVEAGKALDDGWSPHPGLACYNALITCQGAWNGTFHQLSSTLTSIGDKLRATVGAVGTSEDSADQFDATRSQRDDDVGKYERYR